MTSRRFLVWHPSVHAQFRDELVFYFITVRAFPRDAVYEELMAHLSTTEHTAYRIYRVFGSYDLILRVWVEKGNSDAFADSLGRLEYVVDATPIVVEEIPHHWKYPVTAPTDEISKLTPEKVQSIQERFKDPASWNNELIRTALENSLIRQVDETEGALICFTGIVQTTDRKATDSKALLREIYALIKTFDKLDKIAVYRTRGKFSFLIKCETENSFNVGEFIKELSHTIVVNRCGTVTSILLDPDIRGKEEIGARSIKQVARRDRITLVILPEAYDAFNIKTLDSVRLSLLERWINETLVPNRDSLSESEFKDLQLCLRAIVADDERTFLSTIVATFGPIEREFRRLQGPFIGKVVGEAAISSTIRDALKHIPNAEKKKLDLLSLGDRLDVYVFVIKSKSLSDDPDVIDSWNAEAGLRDAAAHYGEKIFPQWNTELPKLVRFLVRYKKLLKIVRGKAE